MDDTFLFVDKWLISFENAFFLLDSAVISNLDLTILFELN